jgi:lambda family phage tail tape measure protein
VSTPESKIIITADVSKVTEGFARVEADATRLTGALGKIGRDGFKGLEQSARQGLGGLQSQLAGLTSVVARVTGALALLGGAGAAFNGLRNIINELDALNDTADATGASVENLSALEDIGRRTGASFDTVSSILVKFNAQLQAAGNPASTAAQALKAIGLSADDLRRLDPAIALQRTAQALATYADDAGKARLVQELFGKSVREAAPFLKDLAEAGQLNARATSDQALAAEQFNKTLMETQATLTLLARTSVAPLLSGFNDLVAAAKELGTAYGSLQDAPLLKAYFRSGGASLLQVGSAKEGEQSTKAAIAQIERDIARLEKLADGRFAAPSNRVEIGRLQSRLGEERKLLEFFQSQTGLNENYGNEGRNYPRPKIDFNPEPKGGGAPRDLRLANPNSLRLRSRSVNDDGLGQALREYERRQDEATRFNEQLQEQTAQINVSLIQNDRERGEAQIDLDRRVMQERLDVLKIGGVNVSAAQQALNENVLARQASLNDALKPAWERMLESWQDTTRQMAESYNSVMDGVVARSEEVLADFVKTGRLNVRSLADFVIGEIAKMQARMMAAQLFNLAGDAYIAMTGGFQLAKGGVLGPSGPITAFATGGIVDKPTFFGYAGGRMGLMGEAGPEAVMPLTRGPDGKLGVKSQGGSQGVNVTINAQAGVSRAELAAMLPMIKEQLKAELVGSMRRPGFAG